jgi:hypothetical protein
VAAEVAGHARRAFEVLRYRDYAKFDVRIDAATGTPYFTDANPNQPNGPVTVCVRALPRIHFREPRGPRDMHSTKAPAADHLEELPRDPVPPITASLRTAPNRMLNLGMHR